MPITVELQGMFSYSIWPVVVAVALVLIIGIVGLVVFIKTKNKEKPEPVQAVSEPIPEPKPVPLSGEQIKEKYYVMVEELEHQCRDGKVDNRDAYQRLSAILRRFVHELTGVKVHNYTLDEIRRLNMPRVAEVIEECYAPEFSMDKQGDIYTTMNKARMVIREWHS